jgi:hypothetical protein
MAEPTVDIEMDEYDAVLNITCTNCQSVHRKNFTSLTPDSEITCGCGIAFKISGDSFIEAQRALDEFKRTVERYGK